MNTTADSRRMLLGILAVLLVPLGGFASEPVKRVSQKNQREEVLAVADRLLAEPDLIRAAELRGRKSPFVRPKPVAAEPDPASEIVGPAEVAPVRLSNQEVLKLVAEQLQPSGTMMRGADRFVRLVGLGLLREGAELPPASIAGETYRVVIESIQADQFVLRLGGQTLALPTTPAPATGGATLDRPAAPPEPPNS